MKYQIRNHITPVSEAYQLHCIVGNVRNDMFPHYPRNNVKSMLLLEMTQNDIIQVLTFTRHRIIYKHN